MNEIKLFTTCVNVPSTLASVVLVSVFWSKVFLLPSTTTSKKIMYTKRDITESEYIIFSMTVGIKTKKWKVICINFCFVFVILFFSFFFKMEGKQFLEKWVNTKEIERRNKCLYSDEIFDALR